MNRRTFLTTTAGTLLAGAALADTVKKPRLRKAVKYGMIGPGKTVREKFELIKSIGFEGVEIDSPSGPDLAEANEAQKATGIKIHGVIDSVHWQPTHTLSHPDEKVRAKGLEALLGAIDALPADLITLGLNHEQQHQELMLMDLTATFFENPLRPGRGT